MSGMPCLAQASAMPLVRTSVVARLSSTSTADILASLTAAWMVSARTSDSDMPPMAPVCTNSLSSVPSVSFHGVMPSWRATSNRSIFLRPCPSTG